MEFFKQFKKIKFCHFDFCNKSVLIFWTELTLWRVSSVLDTLELIRLKTKQ